MEGVICDKQCAGCALSAGLQPELVCMMSEPDRHYPLMIIGDRPGVNDMKTGKLLDNRWLDLVLDRVVGIPMDIIYKTTVVKCGTPAPDIPQNYSFACADQYLAREIYRVQPKAILVMGEQAMNAVLGLTGITKNRGKWVTKDFGGFEVMVMPTFSPGYAERAETQIKTFAEDIQKAYHQAIGYQKQIDKSKWVLCDTLDKVNELMDYAEQTGKAAFDFETTGLNYWAKVFRATCLSISFQHGSSWVIPLYHQEPVFEGRKVKEFLPPIFTPEQVEQIKETLRRRFFGNPRIHKVAHNLKYDLHVARTLGITLWLGRFDDTMLMHHVLNGRLPQGLKPILDVFYPEFSGYEDETKKYKWDAMPSAILFPYSGVDTDGTLRLSTQFENDLLKDERSYILYRNLMMPTCFALEKAEYKGMLIDRDFTLSFIKEVEEIIKNQIAKMREYKQVKRYESAKREQAVYNKLNEIQEKINAATGKLAESADKKQREKIDKLETKIQKLRDKHPNGHESIIKAEQELQVERNVPSQYFDSKKVTSYKERIQAIKTGQLEVYEGVNFSSPPQMQELLYGDIGFRFKKVKDRFGKEQDGTGKSILEDLNDDTGFLADLLTLRSLEKMLGTYIQGIWDRVDDDCYVHTSFKQIGTYTGRLSSEDPNLQNLPKAGKLKDETSKRVVGNVMKMFSVPEGYTLLYADLSQAELRIIAEYANEQNMLSAFANNVDLHRKTGCAVAGITFEQFDELPADKSKKIRNNAKPVNFGYCLVPGTKIVTSAGIRNIEELRIGDEVLTHLGNWKKVTATQKLKASTVLKIITNSGKSVEITPDHMMRQFFTAVDGKEARFAWSEARDLRVGDYLVPSFFEYRYASTDPKKAFDSEERIVDIKYLDWNDFVYDITVEDDHSFVANGLVSHNCYGQSSEGFKIFAKDSYGVRFTSEEAAHMREAYFKEYPALLHYHELYKAKARQFGCVRTFFGRRIDMSDIYSADNMLRGEAERQAVNSPIQGTVGEWMLFGIALLQHRLDPRVLFVNTVHDSIVFYCPNDLVKTSFPIIKETLENLPTKLYFGKQLERVKMKLDCEFSTKSWKETEPYTVV